MSGEGVSYLIRTYLESFAFPLAFWKRDWRKMNTRTKVIAVVMMMMMMI